MGGDAYRHHALAALRHQRAMLVAATGIEAIILNRACRRQHKTYLNRGLFSPAASRAISMAEWPSPSRASGALSETPRHYRSWPIRRRPKPHSTYPGIIRQVQPVPPWPPPSLPHRLSPKRWYMLNIIMPSTSVAIVGGETRNLARNNRYRP